MQNLIDKTSVCKLDKIVPVNYDFLGSNNGDGCPVKHINSQVVY